MTTQYVHLKSQVDLLVLSQDLSLDYINADIKETKSQYRSRDKDWEFLPLLISVLDHLSCVPLK